MSVPRGPDEPAEVRPALIAARRERVGRLAELFVEERLEERALPAPSPLIEVAEPVGPESYELDLEITFVPTDSRVLQRGDPQEAPPFELDPELAELLRRLEPRLLEWLDTRAENVRAFVTDPLATLQRALPELEADTLKRVVAAATSPQAPVWGAQVDVANVEVGVDRTG
jgi:hypothetical protein